LTYLCLLLTAIALRSPVDANIYDKVEDKRTIVRYFIEVLVVLLTFLFAAQQFTIIRNISLMSYFILGGGSRLTMAWVHVILIWSVFLLRLGNIPLLEDIFGAVACILGWTYLLAYLRAFRLTGPFVVMIGKMFAGDLSRFLLLYVLFLAGFTQAFSILYRTSVDDFITPFNNTLTRVEFSGLPRTAVTLFVASFGNVPVDGMDALLQVNVARGLIVYFLFVIYMVITTILLLNLLIAMMGTTFSEVLERAELEYRGQWAFVLLLLEKGLTPSERTKIRLANQLYRRDQWWLVMEEKTIHHLSDADKEKKKKKKIEN